MAAAAEQKKGEEPASAEARDRCERARGKLAVGEEGRAGLAYSFFFVFFVVQILLMISITYLVLSLAVQTDISHFRVALKGGRAVGQQGGRPCIERAAM